MDESAYLINLKGVYPGACANSDLGWAGQTREPMLSDPLGFFLSFFETTAHTKTGCTRPVFCSGNPTPRSASAYTYLVTRTTFL